MKNFEFKNLDISLVRSLVFFQKKYVKQLNENVYFEEEIISKLKSKTYYSNLCIKKGSVVGYILAQKRSYRRSKSGVYQRG